MNRAASWLEPFVLLAVLLACNRGSGPGSSRKNPIAVDVKTLVAAYASSKQHADATYRGKYVRVSGHAHVFGPPDDALTLSAQPSALQGVARAMERGIVMLRFRSASERPKVALGAPVEAICRVDEMKVNLILKSCSMP